MNPLKSIFNAYSSVCDTLGPIMTLRGTLLFAFIFCAASFAAAPAAVAAGSVTNLGVLTSFWSPLVTDPVTGAQGLGVMANNMLAGASALGKSFSTVALAGIGAAQSGAPVLSTMGSALMAPVVA